MDILSKFAGVKILVIGDVMIDRYWWGSVSRISPEAPVPVVKLERMTLAAGGAANVAVNVAGLGGCPLLVGIIGDDAEGTLFPQVLHEFGVSPEYIITVPDRPTTVKTRVVAHSQQMARIDQETSSNLSAADEDTVWRQIESLIDRVQTVIVSDYGKGLLSDTLLRRVIERANDSELEVLVDPKGKDYSKYANATLLTPNRREAADASGLEENGQRMVEQAGTKLIADLNLKSVLITQGEKGMTLFHESGTTMHLETLAREVYDVTGAGDTVIASLAVALGGGCDLECAANIANVAAGLVVEQVGTSAISLASLKKALDGQ